MRVAVVADGVPGVGHCARHAGKAVDIHAHLEECGRHAILGEDRENLGSALTGAIVEGKGNGAAAGVAMPDRRTENRGGTSPHSPRHERAASAQAAAGEGQGIHKHIVRVRTPPAAQSPGCGFVKDFALGSKNFVG